MPVPGSFRKDRKGKSLPKMEIYVPEREIHIALGGIMIYNRKMPEGRKEMGKGRFCRGGRSLQDPVPVIWERKREQ